MQLGFIFLLMSAAELYRSALVGKVLHAAATVGSPVASGLFSLQGPQCQGLLAVVGSFFLRPANSKLPGWSMALCMLT